jgi:hypothetical protein
VKPIHQTEFGWPKGNCYAACVASLMEIPLEDCPVVPEGEDSDWNQIWDNWYADRGIARLVFPYTPEYLVKGWQILAGITPREIQDGTGKRPMHAVVGLDGKAVHDPHPDSTFFADAVPAEVEILYFLNPANLMRNFG